MWSKLTVDMSELTVNRDLLEEEYKELGGRSLIAQYMIKNVPPECDPLGPENHLIICLPIFAGTRLTTANRLSVGAKSPLTLGIKESNAGGYAGTLLAEQGIKLIIVKGQRKRDGMWILFIDKEGNAVLKDASSYRGINNYQFIESVQKEFGDRVATLSIGSAGERMYKSASIQISKYKSNHPSRAAARGGLGAVMGSKGLKAVVIEKPEKKYQVQYQDEKRFNELCVNINKLVSKGAKKNPFHNIGTISTIEITGANGVLPVENFSGKLFPDYKKVGAGTFMSNLAKRGGRNKLPCQPGCLLQCSNIYNDRDGNYLTSSFEYETIAMFGPNCRISDLDAIAVMDRICDDIGVDTIETANAIAVCMEAGKIKWGDAEAAINLLKEMADGTEFGRILGNGCEATGTRLGCIRIPVAKHQAMPAYDPRNTKGTGVTYATSPMGADHTAGLTMGYAFDDTGRTAQSHLSSRVQVAMCFADSMFCIFAFAHLAPQLPLLAELLAALHGGSPATSRFNQLGVRTLLIERQFNRLAGLTAKDDRLPDFFYQERSPATGSKFDICDYELEVVFDF